MYALQRRLSECGITVSSVHPGMVSIQVGLLFTTDTFRHLSPVCIILSLSVDHYEKAQNE